MSRTKKEALAIVFAAADAYQKNLIDHSLLFLCMDKHKRTYCVEVTFDGSNFQHLTGLEAGCSATRALEKSDGKHDWHVQSVAAASIY